MKKLVVSILLLLGGTLVSQAVNDCHGGTIEPELKQAPNVPGSVNAGDIGTFQPGDVIDLSQYAQYTSGSYQ